MNYDACKDLEFQYLKRHDEKGRLRRVPDFLPVCLQDFLHSGKSELREQQPLIGRPEGPLTGGKQNTDE